MSLVVSAIAGTSFAVSSGLGAGALLLGGSLVAAKNGPKPTVATGPNSGGSGPDLAKANAEGIMADIESLPLRLQVSQAAGNGGLYQDSKTGQIFDFRGKFDPMRFFQQNPGSWEYYMEESKATGNAPRPDVEGYARDWLGGQGIHGPAAEAKLKESTTGSAEYKQQSAAALAKQTVANGQSLAIDTAKTQLGALAGKDDYAGYVRNNADLLSEFEKNGGGMSIEDWGKRHYETYGKKEGRKLTNDGLLSQANDLNLRTQGATFDASLAASQQANATHLKNQEATFAASQKANDLAFNANLAQSGTAARTATALQEETAPKLNAVALANQNAAFRQNLTQSDEAAARSLAQQRTTLPGLNDLSLQLQTSTLKGADAAGRTVNPGLYGIRDTYAQQLQQELAAGANLTGAQRNKVQQQIRGAQAARGNILGDGAAFDEAIAESDYAQNLVTQRRQAALDLLNSRDLAPNFSSVGVVNPTQLVTPNSRAFDALTNPVQTVNVNHGPANFTSTAALQHNFGAATTNVPSLTPLTAGAPDPLALLNPNAGSNAAGAAQSAWTTNTNNAAAASAAAASQPNPWMQGLGLGLQAYSTFNKPAASTTAPVANTTTNLGMGGFSPVCWIARAVLGTQTNQWKLFRAWLLMEAPESFRRRYVRQGERFAAALADKPGLVSLLRPFFLARAHQMEALA